MDLTKVLASNELIKGGFEVLLMVDQFVDVQVEIEAHEEVNEERTEATADCFVGWGSLV